MVVMNGVLREASVMFGGIVVQRVKNDVVWLLLILVFADNLGLMAQSAQDLRKMFEYFYSLSEEKAESECNKG